MRREGRVIELGVDLDGFLRRVRGTRRAPRRSAPRLAGVAEPVVAPLAVVIAPEAVAFGTCSPGFGGG